MSAFSWLRAAYGCALLVLPGALADRLAVPLDGRGRAVARVLGARHLLQAAGTAADPRYPVLAGGAAVDALHSASMLALAALDRPRRRAAALDSVFAASFAVAGLMLARARRS